MSPAGAIPGGEVSTTGVAEEARPAERRGREQGRERPLASMHISLYNKVVNTFAALADPARRRLLEVLAGGERPAGSLTSVAAEEFGLSQPATSRHLRILRESGLVRSRADGARRLYALEPTSLRQVDDWLNQFRWLWASALSALDTEVARGQRAATDENGASS